MLSEPAQDNSQRRACEMPGSNASLAPKDIGAILLQAFQLKWRNDLPRCDRHPRATLNINAGMAIFWRSSTVGAYIRRSCVFTDS